MWLTGRSSDGKYFEMHANVSSGISYHSYPLSMSTPLGVEYLQGNFSKIYELFCIDSIPVEITNINLECFNPLTILDEIYVFLFGYTKNNLNVLSSVPIKVKSWPLRDVISIDYQLFLKSFYAFVISEEDFKSKVWGSLSLILSKLINLNAACLQRIIMSIQNQSYILATKNNDIRADFAEFICYALAKKIAPLLKEETCYDAFRAIKDVENFFNEQFGYSDFRGAYKLFAEIALTRIHEASYDLLTPEKLRDFRLSNEFFFEEILQSAYLDKRTKRDIFCEIVFCLSSMVDNMIEIQQFALAARFSTELHVFLKYEPIIYNGPSSWKSENYGTLNGIIFQSMIAIEVLQNRRLRLPLSYFFIDKYYNDTAYEIKQRLIEENSKHIYSWHDIPLEMIEHLFIIGILAILIGPKPDTGSILSECETLCEENSISFEKAEKEIWKLFYKTDFHAEHDEWYLEYIKELVKIYYEIRQTFTDMNYCEEDREEVYSLLYISAYRRGVDIGYYLSSNKSSV